MIRFVKNFFTETFYERVILSATTLASENVPIIYTEFHTSSCYSVEVTHASDMEIGIGMGEVR